MTLASPDALERRLYEIGKHRYHNNHPFHFLMRDGKLSREQLQAWALNRYYYQSRIPIKDCTLMSRMTDAGLRRHWSQRILDHDGNPEGEGGIRKWLHLCERLGLDREYVESEEGVLPATRFDVTATSATTRTWSTISPNQTASCWRRSTATASSAGPTASRCRR